MDDMHEDRQRDRDDGIPPMISGTEMAPSPSVVDISSSFITSLYCNLFTLAIELKSRGLTLTPVSLYSESIKKIQLHAFTLNEIELKNSNLSLFCFRLCETNPEQGVYSTVVKLQQVSNFNTETIYHHIIT